MLIDFQTNEHRINTSKLKLNFCYMPLLTMILVPVDVEYNFCTNRCQAMS